MHSAEFPETIATVLVNCPDSAGRATTLGRTVFSG